jgi:hypothetical protein
MYHPGRGDVNDVEGYEPRTRTDARVRGVVVASGLLGRLLIAGLVTHQVLLP